jgi:hypothetical protein
MTHTKKKDIHRQYTKEVLAAFAKANCSPFIKDIVHDAGSTCMRRMINGNK